MTTSFDLHDYVDLHQELMEDYHRYKEYFDRHSKDDWTSYEDLKAQLEEACKAAQYWMEQYDAVNFRMQGLKK